MFEVIGETGGLRELSVVEKNVAFVQVVIIHVVIGLSPCEEVSKADVLTKSPAKLGEHGHIGSIPAVPVSAVDSGIPAIIENDASVDLRILGSVRDVKALGIINDKIDGFDPHAA